MNLTKTMNYADYISFWVNYHKSFIKESTYANYSNIIDNHLSQDFKNLQLSDFNTRLLQSYVLEKLETGSVKDTPLSHKTVRDIMVVLKLSIRYLFEHNIIDDFSTSVRFPKEIKETKPEILSTREYKKLISFLLHSNDKKDLGILISALTGLRIGEVCALKFSDICFKSNTLSISKTLQRIYNKENKSKVIVTSPKTSSSIRTIPLNRELRERLKASKAEQNFYVLSGSITCVEPRILRNRLNKVLNLLKIKHYKYHSLRHTFATKCIEAKIDYKTVSVLLGHSNINTTLNLYVHPNESQKKKAINKLTALVI